MMAEPPTPSQAESVSANKPAPVEINENTLNNVAIPEINKVLVERMNPDFGILDKLLALKALSREVIEEVRKLSTSHEKNSRLLELVTKNEKLTELFNALKDTHQEHLVNYVTAKGEYSQEYGGAWPLTELETSILDANQEALVDLLDFTGDEIVSMLYTFRVLNRRQREFICKQSCDYEKATVLLDILCRSSLSDYWKMITCLSFTNQQPASKILSHGGAKQGDIGAMGNHNRPPSPPKVRTGPDPPPPVVVSQTPSSIPVSNIPASTGALKEDKKENKEQEGKISKDDIGRPTEFRHVEHVGWDGEKGAYDMDKLDSESKAFFREIGISPSQLRDRETATFIYNFIEEHGGIQGMKKERQRKVARRPSPPVPRMPASSFPVSASTGTLKADRKTKKEKEGKITKDDIGRPTEFRHVEHVGWDAEKGAYDVDKLDSNMVAFFGEIGISPSQLRDSQTAMFIYNFIEEHGGIQAIKEIQQQRAVGRPPPPVPRRPASSFPVSDIPTSSGTPKADRKNDKGKEGKVSKYHLGTPRGFRHVQRVGWDAEKGAYDVDKLDSDMKAFFGEIGISLTQLKDSETATFIYNFIEQHGGIQAIKEKRQQRGARRPPPPVPSMSGK